MFAVPAREPARYETLDLPENDFPFLRVTVHPGPDERERIAILDASVPAEGRPPLREEVLAPRFSRVEDAQDAETWLVLELGARHQPFHAIDLEVADGRFFREVVVEARREKKEAGACRPSTGSRSAAEPSIDWSTTAAGGNACAFPCAVASGCCACGCATGDDRPLTIRGVGVRVPIERIVFEAASGRSHGLRYGSRDLAAPAFDLARTVVDVGTWAASAARGLARGLSRVRARWTVPGRPGRSVTRRCSGPA